MPRVLRRVFVLLIVLGVAARCGSDDPSIEARLDTLLGGSDLSPGEVGQALSRELRTAPAPAGDREAGSNNATFPTRQTLMEFYGMHGRRLAWSDDSGEILPRAGVLLDTLRRADAHGLTPEDYALDQLERLKARIEEGSAQEPAASQLADFDVLMTASFFRYASDVSSGRVHPDEVRHEWHTNAAALDLVGSLNRALGVDDLANLLDSLPPPMRDTPAFASP